ncbi:MAG: hypothetical protein GTO08_07865 [Deltaproteobacteria bacterium]|nr:hypothetical protein [Deltaproteobacteria bacterium]
MIITIDGKKRVFKRAKENNLRALLEIIYEEIRKDGRMVHRISIDGEEISPEKEEELGSTEITEFKKLEIGTSSRQEVAKESIRDALAFIDYLVGQLRGVVNGLRKKEGEPTGGMLMASLQDLSDFVELFSSIKQTSSVDPRDIIVDGKRVDDLETLMLSAIKETVSTDQGEGDDHTINSIEMILIPVLGLFRKCIIEIDRLMDTEG